MVDLPQSYHTKFHMKHPGEAERMFHVKRPRGLTIPVRMLQQMPAAVPLTSFPEAIKLQRETEVPL